ncbi:MAG: long-chain-fatty-acid--CoA ligase [Alphaproteobacteria bacterium]|nr:MAG: long-chain-fatty-acid--CoA ligase [Alphaproteobacteria bacterium]
MQGLMQDWPLLVHRIIDHAALNHGEREVVTRSVEGPIRRTTYANIHSRARSVAKGLTDLGIEFGDVVATMAWNTDRHLEAWYGIMGIGAVCHTVNPRLFPEQITYIMNHAEDKVMFVDTTFLSTLEGIKDKLPLLKYVIVLTDKANMPETTLDNALCYDEWVAKYDDDFAWASFDENTAAGLCYTSGTTGNPKGVLYSHRSNVLHSMCGAGSDVMGLRAMDAILPVVPMFHANAWAITFAAPASGSKIVMPGSQMDGQSIYELLNTEKVSTTAAVPTVWLGLLNYLEENDLKLPHLNKVVIGGSACPQVMIEKFEKNYGVEVVHAWGMTETSPIGTICSLKPGMEDWDADRKIKQKLKQGRVPFSVEMKITDDDGNDLPRDGVAFGHLKVRGPAIVKAYLKGEGGDVLDEDGWFDTGDVATIDELGYMQITDRSKDVIKSGGEWISSIEIENIAVGHPEVAEAAVIGIAHPKWDERPLLIIVPAEGKSPSKEDILKFLEGKIAKWWTPDDVTFVEELPHTATGKIQKLTLREQFGDYKLPTA